MANEVQSEDITASVANHAFLFKNVPAKEDTNISDIELKLLKFLRAAAERVLIPLAMTKSCQTLEASEQVEECQPNLYKILSKLKDNESVCVYVRKQNCTVYFTQLDEEHVRVITFRSSLPNKIVIEANGPRLITYPETVDVVPKSDLLLSPFFSKQIYNLSQRTCELANPAPNKFEPSFPCIVSDFLVTMLSPVDSAKFGPKANLEQLQIQKKLRDWVNGDGTGPPFRRSGLWTAAKVILYLNLIEQVEKVHIAREAYKLVILEVLVDIATALIDKANWDVAAQMMVKLAGRAKKITLIPASENINFAITRERTLNRVYKIIETIHNKVSVEWESVVWNTTHGSEIIPIARTLEEWKKDCIHSMASLTNYLNKDRLTLSGDSASRDNLDMVSDVESSYATIEQLSEAGAVFTGLSEQGNHNLEVWIWQMEWFVREKLDESLPCDQIFKILKTYFKLTNGFRTRFIDPVCYSSLVLTVSTIVAVLDKIAVREHPLLSEYKNGIDEKLFVNLLLPEKCDMKLVAKLVEYFHQRNDDATKSEWPESCNFTDDSLSSVFLNANVEMQTLKEKIMAETSQKEEEKTEELQRTQKACEELQEKIWNNRHTCTWDSYEDTDDRNKSRCTRCSLELSLKELKVSVMPYQRPLPSSTPLRNAVVFEMLIPKELAFLRDSVLFLRYILQSKRYSPTNKKWMDFSGLESYTKADYQCFFYLASNVKDALSLRTDSGDASLCFDTSSTILDNGMTCIYDGPHLSNIPETVNTFQVATCNESERELYKPLQFALNSTRATENAVIASQFSCHPKLSLREFKAFGSIRCSSLVQIRNLFVELSSRSLSLNTEPVLQLIMQTLWDIGPLNRENHVDFEVPDNEGFVNEFLVVLESIFVENSFGCGISNPIVFLSVTMITLRILIMSDSDSIKQMSGELLKMYRQILYANLLKMAELVNEIDDKEEMNRFFETQLKCALAMVLTFNVVAEKDTRVVMSSSLDINHYLTGLCCLNNLVTRETELSRSLPSQFIRRLLRLAQVHVPLSLLPYLISSRCQKFLSEGIHDFVLRQWSSAAQVIGTPIYTSGAKSKKHALQAVYKLPASSHRVCVDALRGNVFVDGFLPSGMLPESIVLNPIFLSFFRTSQFRAERHLNVFRAQYMGTEFIFTEPCPDPIIRQTCFGGEFYELLPKKLFKGIISNDLVDNFTHWLCSKSKSIYFRSKSADSTATITNSSEYFLENEYKGDGTFSNNWRLGNYQGHDPKKSSYQILSIHSQGFQIFAHNLVNLEARNFIHVVMSTDGNITGTLWRLGLSFVLQPADGLLYCTNFPDFYVPIRQNSGTLVGLQGGLILEKKSDAEPSGTNKKLIVQHGDVVIRELVSHQRVGINIRTPMPNPTYFVYDFDQVLNRIKPGNSKAAWLYLALLHASTSSPFPDPFTQLTGTEMAMWILNSAATWSCSPYDDECKTIIDHIYNLASRTRGGQRQTDILSIYLPSGLKNNSYAAYDGYSRIAQYLWHDSERLAGVFTAPKEPLKTMTLNEFQLHSYKRFIKQYNKAAHLIDNQMPLGVHKSRDSILPLLQTVGKKSDLSTLIMFRNTKILAQTAETNESFILQAEPLLPYNHEQIHRDSDISLWLAMPFRYNWLRLYSLARNRAKESREGNENSPHLDYFLTFVYGAMLYSKNASINQLLNLHNAEILPFCPNPEDIIKCLPYSVEIYEFDRDVISSLLLKSAVKPPLLCSYNSNDEYKSAVEVYEKEVKEQVNLCVETLWQLWPTPSLTPDQLQQAMETEHHLTYHSTLENLINSNLQDWYNNLTLRNFIADLDKCMGEATTKSRSVLTDDTLSPQDQSVYKVTTTDFTDYTDKVWRNNEKPFQGLTVPIATSSVADISPAGRLTTDFKTQRNAWQKSAQDIISSLQHFLVGKSLIDHAMERAGLHQRLSPLILLRNHLLAGDSTHVQLLAILWTNIKRLMRLIKYSSDPNKYTAELERELSTIECENWSVKDNPEWLLLELELDVTIRNIQVDVARQMIKMPLERNGVMQLNMGEGKTSVIIPMIASTLTSTKDILCRVTVPNSIFNENYQLLGTTIGGLLNKRIYVFPCSRDLDMSRYLSLIKDIYVECMRLGGIVFALPEYRLSFRLQMYTSFLQGDGATGMKMYEIESWLRTHARDLLDESDEILGVKYQLIHTSGSKQKVDGDSLRWTVCQKLLKIVPQVGAMLAAKYGSKLIEFKADDAVMKPEQFPHIRILKDDCKEEFANFMADAALRGGSFDELTVQTEDMTLVKEFLTNANISVESYQKYMLLSNRFPPNMADTLMLISGYLRRGILFTALMKRWRVDYGLKKGSSAKFMAVPFKAKDVASERTEFGHPDVAIVLTQLSYFYTGLSDDHLMQCFAILTKYTINMASKTYSSWIQEIPPQSIKSEAIRTFEGVNLQDYQQRKNFLFPMLRHHMTVINFWLDNIAFPKECKVFPGKFVTNAFDLCYEGNSHPSTGFSGTNDTSRLLPVQITQQDLASLSKTNSQMEEILKRRENTWKRSLNVGDGCETIITHLIKDGIRVLIDSGALMLQLTNEGIAKRWLELDLNIEAVVYFNDQGKLAVKVRSTFTKGNHVKDSLFALSPYKDKLDNCAVYLDDEHTRGTDIKMPTGWKACVTVGSFMRRDKLMQACMRMRKLGKGQSVHFYLSHEVHNKISLTKVGPAGEISVSDILDWSKANSAEFEKTGLVHWATNARNYSKNLAADKLFEGSGKTEAHWKELARLCEDSVNLSIKTMYGSYHHTIFTTTSIRYLFCGIAQKLLNSCVFDVPDSIRQSLLQMERNVFQRCVNFIPDRVCLKRSFDDGLDEDIDEELEPEQEEEEEVQRCSKQTPIEAKLHENVIKTVMTQDRVESCEGIVLLFDIFRESTIKDILEVRGAGESCFATEDFVNTIVVRPGRYHTDEYLKSIRWVVSFEGENGTTLLILSQFEVNSLIKAIREDKLRAGTRLHLFTGRGLESQSILINDSKLQLPVHETRSHKGAMMASSMSNEVLVPMLIASGNLYFGSDEEEKGFVKFLGLAPKPWGPGEALAFERGLISSTGFVSPECSVLRQGCHFHSDPVPMVLGIIKMRNEEVPESNHVVRVLKIGPVFRQNV